MTHRRDQKDLYAWGCTSRACRYRGAPVYTTRDWRDYKNDFRGLVLHWCCPGDDRDRSDVRDVLVRLKGIKP